MESPFRSEEVEGVRSPSVAEDGDTEDLEAALRTNSRQESSRIHNLELADRVLIGVAFASSVLQMAFERESEKLAAALS